MHREKGKIVHNFHSQRESAQNKYKLLILFASFAIKHITHWLGALCAYLFSFQFQAQLQFSLYQFFSPNQSLSLNTNMLWKAKRKQIRKRKGENKN